MFKFLSILCFALLVSASLAKKSTADKAVDTANEIKDKVVETVRLLHSLTIFNVVSSRSKMPPTLRPRKSLKVRNLLRTRLSKALNSSRIKPAKHLTL